MAHDYMAIPGSTCLAERSFLILVRTDDVRHCQMDGDRFGALQQLQSAYRDGHLEAINKA